MCAQYCPANSYVKDGKVIRLEASPVHEYAGTCGRSRAAGGALYSADRITTPLIRTGERGEGKYRQASWDEALDLIGAKLKKLRDDGEPEKVVLFSRFSSAMVWDGKFFDLYGTPNNVSYGDTCFEVVSRSFQAILGFGGPGSHSGDYENADYGLIVGKNLGGAIIPHGWGAQFGKGLRHGLPLTVVDPRHPNEMAQSYAEWLPIRPGTDLSFLLGVLHFVVRKGYVDKGFLPKTNLDALIVPETLMPVKMNREVTPHDYLVYDTATGSFVMSRNATAPAYQGRYDYNGTVVQPAMELMKKVFWTSIRKNCLKSALFQCPRWREWPTSCTRPRPRHSWKSAIASPGTPRICAPSSACTRSTCSSGSTGMRVGCCRIASQN
jgi:anaerobic selenocysteine-containing dehydrogenase